MTEMQTVELCTWIYRGSKYPKSYDIPLPGLLYLEDGEVTGLIRFSSEEEREEFLGFGDWWW